MSSTYYAFDEVVALAKKAFPDRIVAVGSAINSDEYKVEIDGRLVAFGTLESVTKTLNQAKTFLGK